MERKTPVFVYKIISTNSKNCNTFVECLLYTRQCDIKFSMDSLTIK